MNELLALFLAAYVGSLVAVFLVTWPRNRSDRHRWSESERDARQPEFSEAMGTTLFVGFLASAVIAGVLLGIDGLLT